MIASLTARSSKIFWKEIESRSADGRCAGGSKLEGHARYSVADIGNGHACT